MNISKNIIHTVTITGALLLVGAGSALAGPGHGNGSLPFGEPGSAGEVDRTIELNVDGMTYGVEKLDIQKGETIRFVITNGSEIAHDFTIGDKATQLSHRTEMAEMMEQMDANSGMMNHDDANAAFLPAGDSDELIWTFDKAGRFEFACNVPGHYEAGMHGQISVADANG